jgi:transcriptional regulator with XRE-family HTH domain
MENDLINRFIEIRKNHGLTQVKFGKIMGLSDGTISMIESGQRPISEKHIKLICGTLGINETWLKTGEGPVFTEEIPGQKQLLEAFKQLSPNGRKIAIKVVEALLEGEIEQAWNEGAGIVEPAPEGATRPPEAPQEVKTRESTDDGKGERRVDTSKKPI